MAELTNRERMQIQRQDMPTQEPEVRAGNFEEVALGLTCWRPNAACSAPSRIVWKVVRSA